MHGFCKLPVSVEVCTGYYKYSTALYIQLSMAQRDHYKLTSEDMLHVGSVVEECECASDLWRFWIFITLPFTRSRPCREKGVFLGGSALLGSKNSGTRWGGGQTILEIEMSLIFNDPKRIAIERAEWHKNCFLCRYSRYINFRIASSCSCTRPIVVMWNDVVSRFHPDASLALRVSTDIDIS